MRGHLRYWLCSVFSLGFWLYTFIKILCTIPLGFMFLLITIRIYLVVVSSLTTISYTLIYSLSRVIHIFFRLDLVIFYKLKPFKFSENSSDRGKLYKMSGFLSISVFATPQCMSC